MTTTTQIRSWWDPACKANVASLTEAYTAMDIILKKWNYAPRQEDTGAFNCRPITGGTGFSLHAYDPDGFFYFWNGTRVTKALAVDINWKTNEYGTVLVTDMPLGMVLEIQAIRTKNGKQVWRSGRFYSGNIDAMHMEIIVSPVDLSTGIVLPIAGDIQEGDDDLHYKIAWIKATGRPGSAYRVLFGKGKDDKLVPVMAFDIDGDDSLDRWRGRLEEIPSTQPITANTWIAIMDGPYKNVD